MGDFAKVLKVANLPEGSVGFSAAPGDVWADISTEAAPVGYSPGLGGTGMFHEVRFVRSVDGQDVELVATQHLTPVGFDPGVGALAFFATAPGPPGGYLVVHMSVALPADLKTVAEALALLTGIVFRIP